jgi:hypothetical protein
LSGVGPLLAKLIAISNSHVYRAAFKTLPAELKLRIFASANVQEWRRLLLVDRECYSVVSQYINGDSENGRRLKKELMGTVPPERKANEDKLKTIGSMQHWFFNELRFKNNVTRLRPRAEIT